MSNQEAVEDFPGEYRLDVEDFGPIAKANVDLRPLTVFIGPSNTGKSYLAILLYALHRCLSQGNSSLIRRSYGYRYGLLSPVPRFHLETDDDISDVLDSFRNWFLFQDGTETNRRPPIDMDSDLAALFEMASWGDLPEDVDAYIRSAFENEDGLGRYAEREIGRCFGVDNMSSLVRRSSSGPGARIELAIPRSADAGMVRYGGRLSESGAGFAGEISGAKSLSNEIKLSGRDEAMLYGMRLSLRKIDDGDLRSSLARIAESIFESLLGPIYRNAYYLPASRTGVMHSHQVVVSTVIQNATTVGIRRSANIPILSGVLADFLSELIEMSVRREPSHERLGDDVLTLIEDVAKALERNVLRGAIRLDQSESGYPFFDYIPNGWDEALPLIRASSMVSELAPVVLYLRHVVRPGDVLIIEEPESHLHPGMQVAFTRQLAALVRADIRVIVTTHSEWLLQELANLVRVSQIPEGERAGIAGGEVALGRSQVGAWLFRPGESDEGSTVSEIDLDESGLYPSDFEDVAIAMHNEWAEISSRLGEDG